MTKTAHVKTANPDLHLHAMQSVGNAIFQIRTNGNQLICHDNHQAPAGALEAKRWSKMSLSDWNLEASEEQGMMRALQEEARNSTICEICGAEINNDSFFCTRCDEETHFPESVEE